jgi:hypothetical protein
MDAWMNTTIPTFTHNHPHVLPAFVVFPPLEGSALDPWPGDQVLAQIVSELTDGPLHVYSIESRTASSAGLVNLVSSEFVLMPGKTHSDLAGIDKRIAAIALNAWLIHTYEPELITTDLSASQPGMGFARRQSCKPYAPTWIGRDFKVRRVGQAASSGEHGVKVRPHWRSGHWHTVRHGQGRQQERLQWYRPVYVNSDATAGT